MQEFTLCRATTTEVASLLNRGRVSGALLITVRDVTTFQEMNLRHRCFHLVYLLWRDPPPPRHGATTQAARSRWKVAPPVLASVGPRNPETEYLRRPARLLGLAEGLFMNDKQWNAMLRGCTAKH